MRELTIFGTNAVENTPLDGGSNQHMTTPKGEIAVRMSRICDKYDLDYWFWTPAVFDLADRAKRAEFLAQLEELFRTCPRLDGIYFPGGDPGDNHPKLVFPFLQELAGVLAPYHPEAGVWFSAQTFREEEWEYYCNYLSEHQPDWLAGVVGGPQAPPCPRCASASRRDGEGHSPRSNDRR